jgi:hypothetical protein
MGWLGAGLARLFVGPLQFGRSGPQQVKLDSVEAIELAEVVTIGNVIGNSAGETGGYHHAVDGAQATLRTVRVERVTAREIFAREYNPPKCAASPAANGGASTGLPAGITGAPSPSRGCIHEAIPHHVQRGAGQM